MVLAIDIGNTNISIGCFREENMLLVEQISTNHTATALEYAISMKLILEIYHIPIAEIEGCIISSVVPSITNVMQQALRMITKKTAMVVGPGIRTGLKICIDNPAQLGSNLVVEAVAALQQYPVPLVMIDMGTATTISVINDKSEYIGGMILPGVKVSADALSKQTAQLPRIALEPPKKRIGSNTVDCMKSGVLYGTACSLDGLIAQIEAELQQPVTAVATGEIASVIIPCCKRKIQVDDKLLLRGLQIIYLKNKKEWERKLSYENDRKFYN
jgi:type III pantothenate kinase